MDIRRICVEEIGLEGLDGITLPTLWLRMNRRKPKLPYEVCDKLREYLWRFILDHTLLRIVQIPRPREEPQVFERTKSLDEEEVPTATAPDELDTLVEVYSNSAVQTDEEGIRGCCSDYSERVDIKDDIIEQSLDLTTSFAKYGRQRIVVVASQSVREHAMLSGNISRVLLEHVSDHCYCVLELIARSRWEGVIQSRLAKLNFRNKAYQAIVKTLQVLGLVTKSHHTYKTTRTCTQILVNLKKYERTSLALNARVMKGILTELQNAPDHSMNLGVLKEKFKTRLIQFKYAYRMLTKTGEITISKQRRSVCEWTAALAEKRDDPGPVVHSDDLVLVPLTLNRPILNQAYDFIKQNAVRGVSQADMHRLVKDISALEARYIITSLVHKDVLDAVLIDRGKQRVMMYFPKTVSANCGKSEEFIAVKKKMQELVLLTKYDECTQDAAAVDLHANNSESSKLKETKKSRIDQLNPSVDVTAKSDMTHLKKWDANLTARAIKRHNLILEFVNGEKIVTGLTKLKKLITTADEKDGVTCKVDSISVTRLVKKMNANGVLKHDEVQFTHREVTENYHFLRSLDCPNALYESAIEQERFEYIAREEGRIARQEQEKAENQKREMSKKEEAIEENPVNPYLQPRFKRLRVLHEFLWYLAHGHPLSDTANDGNLEAATLKLYNPEFTWKRYLPSAPIHTHVDHKWLQIGELASIMPLSILCQFHRPWRMTEELEGYLRDADKSHTPVRHLPSGIKCLFLGKRRFIYSLVESVHQLFFMGLVTMTCKVGNGWHMPKESLMVYVHRNATVVDTRTSCAGFMKVEEKNYERIAYRLDDAHTLESFWDKMQAVCMQTKLGSLQYMKCETNAGHLCTTAVGKFVKSSLETRPEPRDDGHIPGDGLGTGGLDSSFFSFLPKNWYTPQAWNKRKADKCRKRRLRADADIPGEVKSRIIDCVGSAGVSGKDSKSTVEMTGKSGTGRSARRPAKEIKVTVSNRERKKRAELWPGVKRKFAIRPVAIRPSPLSSLLNSDKKRFSKMILRK